MSRTEAKRPLLIVHAVRQFSPGIGGIEAFVAGLCREQLKGGHNVRVVTLDRIFHGNGGRLAPREVLDGVEIRRVPYLGSHRYPIAPKVLGHIYDADVVHVHAIDFIFDYLALTKGIHRRKLVVSTHGGFFHTEYAKVIKKMFFSTVTRLSLSQYDYVAASSAQDEETFKSIRQRNIGLIENGVDVDKFRGCAADAPLRNILAFGRIAPNKSIPSLFPFLCELRKRDGDWQLAVAGAPRGASFEELRAAAQAAGVAESVELIDSPSDDRLRELISRSSVFASASAYEGFGIAAIEAISAGLFPVLSDIPPHRRTIDTVGFGLAMDFSNADAAVARFLPAWHDWCSRLPAQRARFIGSVDRYTWPAVAKRFDEVYRAVIG